MVKDNRRIQEAEGNYIRDNNRITTFTLRVDKMNFINMVTMMRIGECWSCDSLQRGKWSLHVKLSKVGIVLMYYDVDRLLAEIPLHRANYKDKSWKLKDND